MPHFIKSTLSEEGWSEYILRCEHVQHSRAVCSTMFHPPVPASRMDASSLFLSCNFSKQQKVLQVQRQVVLLVVKADTWREIWSFFNLSYSHGKATDNLNTISLFLFNVIFLHIFYSCHSLSQSFTHPQSGSALTLLPSTSQFFIFVI